MARLVLVLGKSGTGKSTSLRNFKAEEVSVMSVTGKELPFPTDIVVRKTYTYEEVLKGVLSASKPVVVIDDANYLMSKYEFSTIGENGYGKFARNAQSMVKVLEAIAQKDSDQTYYVFSHLTKDEDGTISFKTTGKMVDEKYGVSGVTNIVLEAFYDKDSEGFYFRTKADGSGVKTPMGMFTEDKIENDLKKVNDIITAYYKPKTKEEK